MFHADTLFDNEESFGLPEIEERDLSASLTLRWSRKRKRWECRNAFFWQDAKNMLSYITLHPEDWQSHSYVACCGTSIQPVLKLLERQPQINTVLLCLDNDEAGHLASRRMEEQLAERYTVERLIPTQKLPERRTPPPAPPN